MKAATYDYAKPFACDEAIALIGPTEGMGKFVAGSQSLGPMMNLRLAQPEMLVDLRGIAALRACSIEGETVALGACITHAEIEDGKVETGTRGLMEYVARGIAYRAVRNRGTLGGSLAHADPAADWINTMCALDATFLVAGPGGARTIGNRTWMAGAFTTALEPDEILTGVRFARLSPTARWSYYKFNRKPGEFAEAIAVFIDDAARGVCRAVIGAIDAPPYAIDDARALLRDADPDTACFDAHLEAAGVEAGSYEHEVHRVALVRAAAAIRHQDGTAS
ncbi:FAD binding domain-containing protein [Paraburkholderia phymatum]|uniref:Molybdopterin dehydrogenase FAD-binding n=1 Tax=Paraburkholderia phymatum (strain DSM 17167 / CIP 108236 / LMG 21445 / STM815) TaxID=391038 RepID=B2JQW9_PARP8|nr:FAD binding domain-containing protein [Paraburkholderia phymatum]ACC73660.1 molybdopterin dehydrogenase FAD-binding [Paraburkholderia phymatum STM815]